MVRANISKQCVGTKVSDFFQKIDASKTILNDQVIHRILQMSDNRTQVSFGETCKKVQNIFQKKFVSYEKIYRETTTFNDFEVLKKGMVLKLLPSYGLGRATYQEAERHAMGHYLVHKISKLGVHLRRLTNYAKATIGKKKFFIPFVYSELSSECLKSFPDYHEHFYETLSDNWEIIATTKKEYLPKWKEHWNCVMPGRKIKNQGYPKLRM